MSQADMLLDEDERRLGSILDRVSADGTIDASGVRLSSEGLRRILQAAPRDPDRPGRPLLRDASFKGTTFSGKTEFDGATFLGATDFTQAAFRQYADFRDTVHAGDTSFKRATFGGNAQFARASFGGEARFQGTTCSGIAVFDEASFEDAALFYQATFARSASFRQAHFGDRVDFGQTSFGGSARFVAAMFPRARQFGPAFVFEQLVFDEAAFGEQVRIEFAAKEASLCRTAFRGGADLLIRWAEVALDQADLSQPSLIAPLPVGVAHGRGGGRMPFLGRDEPLTGGAWCCRLDRAPSSPGFAPRVVSVRHAKVSGLVLSGVDARACSFEGAHGLDKLILENAQFAETPSGWHWQRPWLWPRKWTRRRALAEEHRWRSAHSRSAGWYGPAVRAPEWLGEPEEITAAQISAIYRALRKGQEESKDEPGAADFYYGEMEMRRNAAREATAARRARSLRAERAVLSLYWLVSGYGLRASRALLSLLVTIALFAVCFWAFGFDPRPPFARALLFSAESTSSLFRVPETPEFSLTYSGEALQIALRLLGPLFFGLALLSLRGRVKR